MALKYQKKSDEADNKLYNQLMSNHNFTEGCWATCSLMILTKKEYLKVFNFCIFRTNLE